MANIVRPESKNVVDFIQEMKYHLVLESDGQVFLGDGFKEEDKTEKRQKEIPTILTHTQNLSVSWEKTRKNLISPI